MYLHTNLTSDPASSERILSYDSLKSNVAELFTDKLGKMNKLYSFQYLNDTFCPLFKNDLNHNLYC